MKDGFVIAGIKDDEDLEPAPTNIGIVTVGYLRNVGFCMPCMIMKWL